MKKINVYLSLLLDGLSALCSIAAPTSGNGGLMGGGNAE